MGPSVRGAPQLLPWRMVDYIITGFGQFHNVELNPSEILVKRLPSYLKEPTGVSF